MFSIVSTCQSKMFEAGQGSAGQRIFTYAGTSTDNTHTHTHTYVCYVFRLFFFPPRVVPKRVLKGGDTLYVKRHNAVFGINMFIRTSVPRRWGGHKIRGVVDG